MAKLYAKITNENGKTASKSGERLTITLSKGNKTVAEMRIGREFFFYDNFLPNGGTQEVIELMTETGKTQKDERYTEYYAESKI